LFLIVGGAAALVAVFFRLPTAAVAVVVEEEEDLEDDTARSFMILHGSMNQSNSCPPRKTNESIATLKIFRQQNKSMMYVIRDLNE
jgi:hypothetical protein